MIPKYVDKLLEKRAKAAEKFIEADSQIVEWLEKNSIVVDEIHINTGACSICEPYLSIDAIRTCINEQKGQSKDGKRNC